MLTFKLFTVKHCTDLCKLLFLPYAKLKWFSFFHLQLEMYHVSTQYERKHDLDNENKRIRSCIGKAEKIITVMSH